MRSSCGKEHCKVCLLGIYICTIIDPEWRNNCSHHSSTHSTPKSNPCNVPYHNSTQSNALPFLKTLSIYGQTRLIHGGIKWAIPRASWTRGFYPSAVPDG